MAGDKSLDLGDIKRRMDGALATLKQEFSGLRTGRASANLLDGVKVDAYGSLLPLNQMATISVPEPRLIVVQVWDKSQTSLVEKAIRNAGLGINPVVEGAVLRIPIPELNEERRAEISKVASRYSEQARIAVRNVRRDGMDKLKKLEKDGLIGEDEHRSQSDKIQSLTDTAIAEIDKLLASKEKEVMQV
jgi:ribosome recycling factor